MEIQENVPLARFTTLQIGGPARYYLQASDLSSLAEGIAWSRRRGLPRLVLGGGSNVLIDDAGFPGLVIHVHLKGLRQEGDTLVAAAGEVWDDVVAAAVEGGLAGIECLSGIPGRVGATPMQNVGAYGQEVCETISEVRAWDIQGSEVAVLSPSECRFSYRNSRFKSEDAGRYVILEVSYRLRKNGTPSLHYADLKRHLDGMAAPGLMEVREAVLSIRRAKGMVLDARDADTRSVGSFFLNPVLTDDEASSLEDRLRERSPLTGDQRVAGHRSADGRIKVSAAWLIEKAGFHRGWGSGPVGISSKHTLALINRGEGRAADVLTAAACIRQGVYEAFGVRLRPDPVFVGCSLD